MEGGLEFLLVLSIMGIIGALVSPPFFRADYLRKKVLHEIVVHGELSDGLKNEARFMLGDKRYTILATDWIRNNEDQFSGELLATAKEVNKISKICERRLLFFMFMFLAVAGVVTLAI